MRHLPEPFLALVDQLSRLPGLGPKSALRCALALLRWPEGETRRLGTNLLALRDSLRLCSRCNAVTDTDPCPICSDPSRAGDTLCLVVDWDSLLTLEDGAFYSGQFFILGGLLASREQSAPDSPELETLDARLAENEVREVILALGATVEADATASFLRNRLAARFPHIRITRLAQGIPLGGEVKFMDKETLRQSLRYRQDLE
ncbi:MAG: recombination mediator RecR [Desulfovibrio sp.]|jgi:recombination protein RecR|nr:recombination mediator RecR [Desulfovibrio sp.]